MSSDPSELCLQPCLRWNREKKRRWSELKPRRKFEGKKLSLLTAKPDAKKSPTKKELQNLETKIKEIVLQVCLGDNVDTPSESSDIDEGSPQLVFDPDNPQQLDLQGLDYQKTYRQDEQLFQEDREYQTMKRELDKQTLYREELERYAQRQRDRRFGLPDLFNMHVRYLPSDVSLTPAPEPENLSICESITTEEELEKVKKFDNVELWRTEKKPHNVAVRAAEFDRRLEELHMRLDKIEEKEKLAVKQKEKEAKELKETFTSDLAQADFEAIFTDKKDMKMKTVERLPNASKRERKKFPNNYKGIPKLRRKLSVERLELRDKALIKEEVLTELGKPRSYPEKFLSVDPEIDPEVTNANDDSSNSTDSEDGLSVGYKTREKFQLRGFQDVLSSEPRGLHLNRGPKPQVHTCMTRDEWIQSILVETTPKKSRNRLNLKIVDPNHSQFDIFQKPWRPRKPVVSSPVAEYIKGGSKEVLKDAVTIKDPTFIPPERIKTKKFSLTRYLYGEGENTAAELRKATAIRNKLRRDLKGNPLLKQVVDIRDKEKLERRRNRHQRLYVLKIPYRKVEDCTDKSGSSDYSSDSDVWMPGKEELDPDQFPSRVSLRQEKIPLKVSNMRAPDHREPTLKRHPRRLRSSADKILTALDYKDSRVPFNDPRICKMDPDKINHYNLDEPKHQDLQNVVKYRFHHDHQVKHQQKLVRVKYVPKVSKFDPPQFDTTMTGRLKFIPELPVKEDETRNRDWSRYASEIDDEVAENELSDKDDYEKLISSTAYEDKGAKGKITREY